MVAEHRLPGVEETEPSAREWIASITSALGSQNQRHGYVAMRSVLHAIRVHLTAEEAAQLSAQLPMFVPGTFYEGWDGSEPPLGERSAAEFLQRVGRVSAEAWLDPSEASHVVTAVLRRRLPPDAFEGVMGALPQRIRELLQPVTAQNVPAGYVQARERTPG